MIRELTVVFLIGFALTYAIPVSKTTSLHGAYPTITTPLGDIQGAIINSRLGKHIYAFRGIRYAKAPVEDLRFQPPVVPDRWEGVYNATQDGPSCPQEHMETTSEDCLLLNVYTTKLPKGNDNPKRPVIVFFHSGDFTNNSAASHLLGPQYLLDQDIVLVTANYRLGVLGFLNTGDKEATGNFGLKDQVEVLKWVKANVIAFGGNPDSVTLAGAGSGGISVSLHLVSAGSKGLFQKAIVMSGSGFGNIPVPSNLMDLATHLAEHLKCPHEKTSDMVKCFKTKTAKELSEVDLNEVGEDPYFTWKPTIEQEDFGQTRFLTGHPVELISHGHLTKVPIMIGLTADEFGSRAFDVVGNATLLAEFEMDFERIAPISFMYDLNDEYSSVTTKSIRSFYFADKKIDNSSLPKLAELYSDAIVGFAVNRAASMVADKNNESVFYYKFNYKGKLSNFYLPHADSHTPYGVVNADDLLYLFQSNKFAEFKESDEETTTIQKMVTIWTNFANSGKPIPTVIDILDNVKWEPYTTKTKKYMDIGNKLVMHENMNEKRYAEWEKHFPTTKYARTHTG